MLHQSLKLSKCRFWIEHLSILLSSSSAINTNTLPSSQTILTATFFPYMRFLDLSLLEKFLVNASVIRLYSSYVSPKPFSSNLSLAAMSSIDNSSMVPAVTPEM